MPHGDPPQDQVPQSSAAQEGTSSAGGSHSCHQLATDLSFSHFAGLLPPHEGPSLVPEEPSVFGGKQRRNRGSDLLRTQPEGKILFSTGPMGFLSCSGTERWPPLPGNHLLALCMEKRALGMGFHSWAGTQLRKTHGGSAGSPAEASGCIYAQCLLQSTCLQHPHDSIQELVAVRESSPASCTPSASSRACLRS